MSADSIDLDAIRARVDAATVGPWSVAEQTHGDWFGIQDEWLALGSMFGSADAEFIAHARTDVPALLAEVERLREYVVIAKDAARDASDSRAVLADTVPAQKVRELANRGTGTDMNPTRLASDVIVDGWWIDYLRTLDSTWRRRLRTLLPDEEAGRG